MDPSVLVPKPDALPICWGWFQILLIITLFLHIILMNVMLGTGIIAFVNLFRSNGSATPLSRNISGKLPFAIAFTVNFGIAPLLFVQVLYGNFLYASSVLMANFWLSVIGLLIASYYLAYIFNYKYNSLKSGRILLLGFSVTSMLLIGFLMSNNFTMMQRPDVWVRYFEKPTGLLLNLADPTLFPRYFHFITAAIAIGGLSIALYYEYLHKKGDESAQEKVQYGCNWFGYATIVNYGFGFWFFGTLPAHVHNINTLTGTLIALFLLTAITLGGFAIVFSLRGQVMPTLYTVLMTIFLMILIRDLVRVAYLKPFFSLSDLTVVPQYSPFILFLIFFIGGLALVGWMLKLAWNALDNEEVQS